MSKTKDFSSEILYNAHEDRKYHKKTVSAIDSIKLIIKHLVSEQFKIIRYYGFYRKKHKLHNKLKLSIEKGKRSIRNQLLQHKMSILRIFSRNSYNCPKCYVKLNYISKIT